MCYRDKKRGMCAPEDLCKFNYNCGDLTFNQSCRVKDESNLYPQQIKLLAFTGKKVGTAMTVSWATFANVEDSSVWMGETKDKL
ncbi:hypothetical protein CCR75_001399 [Bremia lactucae]|uniref:Uncharacterized protein n=1 Tax=Bremia lactucae TaxID=4779 RepID=A0A976IDM4_BRELC|nr:hypothetical protein CCR75_001399 [Bremia lactucae]